MNICLFLYINSIGGQTWLQLQQQKLRAKKEQQRRGIDTVDYIYR